VENAAEKEALGELFSIYINKYRNIYTPTLISSLAQENFQVVGHAIGYGFEYRNENPHTSLISVSRNTVNEAGPNYGSTGFEEAYVTSHRLSPSCH
jgi:hypothetical protein